MTCGQTAASCTCHLDEGHTEPHACDCGGKWTGRWQDETFDVVEYPIIAWMGSFDDDDDEELGGEG